MQKRAKRLIRMISPKFAALNSDDRDQRLAVHVDDDFAGDSAGFNRLMGGKGGFK